MPFIPVELQGGACAPPGQVCAGALGSPNKALCGTSNTECDLQAAGIASAYGSRAGAVGPQCLKLRLHFNTASAPQRPTRRLLVPWATKHILQGVLPPAKLHMNNKRCQRSGSPLRFLHSLPH